MRRNMLVLTVIIIAAYLVGTESAKGRRGKNYEDFRHQAERLWTSPDAKKSRKRIAKKARKSVAKARKSLLGR